jgi:hypothetical protein
LTHSIYKKGYNKFSNGGILLDDIADFDFAIISKEIEKIKNNFNQATIANPDLVGQLEQSYELVDSRAVINRNAKKLAAQLNTQINIESRIISMYQHADKDNYSLELSGCWANFQKKYEYQPIHDHTGIYSFIIFYSIPFLINEEQKHAPGKLASDHFSGLLNFHYVDYLGSISTMVIPADATWNKKMIIFPANLKHSVHPFYSSDDYRITISGNLCFTRNP